MITKLRVAAAFFLLCVTPLALSFSLGGEPPRVPTETTRSASVTAPQEPGDSSAELAAAPPSAICLNRWLAPIQDLTSGPQRGVATPEHDAEVVHDFVGQVEQRAQQLRQSLRSDGVQPYAAQVETLIATVPDPIDSGLVHQFETAVQALRTGVEHDFDAAHGDYFRDRYYAPWEDRSPRSANALDPQGCRKVLPGLQLFRNSKPGQPRVLALLLVGETPTAGLRGAVMLNALRLARALEGPVKPAATRVIRIAGPSFSGSAYGLRLALRAYAAETREKLRFHVISGMANGNGLPELLNVDSLPPFGSSRFYATNVPEAAADCAYLDFLHEQLGVPASEPSRHALPSVVTLHELGTEFGVLAPYADCGWSAGASLAFPRHVSNLRDAYETLEQRSGAKPAEPPLARPTALELSLADERADPDLEATPSPKTRAALDIMLSSLLGEISRRGVQHVAIHATDTGDAIFLARKIRDVAPDVRLAFFVADDLLLHPQDRDVLLGSLVVTPYPFLGISDLREHRQSARAYQAFPNALAQGTFNAVLALRDAKPAQLVEYNFDAGTPLPVWISTLSRTGLIPNTVKSLPARGPFVYDDAAYAALSGTPPAAAVVTASGDKPRSRLALDAAVLIPHLWNVVFMSLVFAFFADQASQARKARWLAPDDMPRSLSECDDRAADRAIGRTQWLLYASIRSSLFWYAFLYMGLHYLLGFLAYGGGADASLTPHLLHCAFCAFVVTVWFVTGYLSFDTFRRFFEDYGAFSRYVGERRLPRSWADIQAGMHPGRISSSAVDLAQIAARNDAPGLSLSRLLGIQAPVTRMAAARISFAQLRVLFLLTCGLNAYFLVQLVGTVVCGADSAFALGRGPVSLPTLNVLRSVSLLNGISPAAPILLCLACIYVWVVGRMARIALAHSLSRISPPDGESDLVSTPLRLVLYPGHVVDQPIDEGYTHCERDLLNAIVRPITGRYYITALIGIVFFPILLFILKPLATLEGTMGTALLRAGLMLAALLIGVTLVQLAQYWVCLRRLLKRTMAHRLGPAFRDLPAFMRDSVDAQLSRSPDELLRWVACSRMFVSLAAATANLRDARLLLRDRDAAMGFGERAEALKRASAAALEVASAPDSNGREPAWMMEQVIAAASQSMLLLESAWDAGVAHRAQPQLVALAAVSGDDTPALAQGAEAEARSESGPAPRSTMLPGHLPQYALARTAAEPRASSPLQPTAANDADALSCVAHCFAPADLQWLRRVQSFVATVVVLLIHRHIRQFRYFASTLTAAALLLLLTVTSYPFEPFRLLLTCIWVVVGTVAFAGIWIYVQLQRNTLLSLASDTLPNHVPLNFALVLRVLQWGVLPLLSVAAAQYPNLANWLYLLVAPFARALH